MRITRHTVAPILPGPTIIRIQWSETAGLWAATVTRKVVASGRNRDNLIQFLRRDREGFFSPLPAAPRIIIVHAKDGSYETEYTTNPKE